MSVTWRICAISAALSRRDMMMAGRKVLPMVEKKDEKKDGRRAEGRAEGLAEGLAEGENKANIATAQRLLAMGLSTDQVSAATQLPIEHIEKLKSSLDTK